MPADAELRRLLLDLARQLVEALAAPGALPGLSPTERAIVQALTDSPVSSRRLARAAGRRWNSHFRAALARLVEGGQVRHTPRGYRRP
jgi:hypothetical protein